MFPHIVVEPKYICHTFDGMWLLKKIWNSKNSWEKLTQKRADTGHHKQSPCVNLRFSFEIWGISWIRETDARRTVLKWIRIWLFHAFNQLFHCHWSYWKMWTLHSCSTRFHFYRESHQLWDKTHEIDNICSILHPEIQQITMQSVLYSIGVTLRSKKHTWFSNCVECHELWNRGKTIKWERNISRVYLKKKPWASFHVVELIVIPIRRSAAVGPNMNTREWYMFNGYAHGHENVSFRTSWNILIWSVRRRGIPVWKIETEWESSNAMNCFARVSHQFWNYVPKKLPSRIVVRNSGFLSFRFLEFKS